MNQLVKNAIYQFELAERVALQADMPKNLDYSGLLAANKRFVELYGEELFPDEDLHMSAPASHIRGKHVLAQIRHLKTSIPDGVWPGIHDPTAAEMLDGVLEAVAEEIRQIKQERLDVELCPYVVLSGRLYLDQHTFEPKMGLSFRCGFLDDTCEDFVD